LPYSGREEERKDGRAFFSKGVKSGFLFMREKTEKKGFSE